MNKLYECVSVLHPVSRACAVNFLLLKMSVDMITSDEQQVSIFSKLAFFPVNLIFDSRKLTSAPNDTYEQFAVSPSLPDPSTNLTSARKT